MGIFLLFGYLAYFGVNGMIGDSAHVVIRAMLAGTIYIAATALVLYKTPVLFGMDRDVLKSFLANMSIHIRR